MNFPNTSNFLRFQRVVREKYGDTQECVPTLSLIKLGVHEQPHGKFSICHLQHAIGLLAYSPQKEPVMA